MANSMPDAVSALADAGENGAPLAGGTWIMRSPIRGEAWRRTYVGIGRIPELNSVEIDERQISVGACVRHAELVASLAALPQCRGLVAAAGKAANPAVRHMATVGGNLSAWGFPASDLSPALLCLDATVELQSADGSERLAMDQFIRRRRSVDPGTILTKVLIPRRGWQTGHARLPLRKAGDYPVAIVSIAARLADDGTVEDIRVAVGSVESDARRWADLEKQLVGKPLEPAACRELAKASLAGFTGRDSVEAPPWYRVHVLPELTRRAAEAVLTASRD